MDLHYVLRDLLLWHMDCLVVRLQLRCSVACGILVLTPRIESEFSALHGWFSITGSGETSLSLSFFTPKKVYFLRLELIYTEIWGDWLIMLSSNSLTLYMYIHMCVYISLHSVRFPISLSSFAHLLLGFSPRHLWFWCYKHFF